MAETDQHQTTSCAVIALIGAPNAGKSTLLNRLVGQKVSIVTHKVQTTRAPIRGIAMHGRAQLVFVDTPGIFEPRRRLERAMVSAAWGGARDADLVALLVDAPAEHKGGQGQAIAEKLSPSGPPSILILNKIDRMERRQLLTVAKGLNDVRPFDRTFMVSALDGDGVPDLLDYFEAAAPDGPWLFPEDQVSDIPLRLMAAETTREKLFLRLHDELPYALSVETEQWKDLKDGSVRIEQAIYVERDSQKGIVLGERGRTIKAVSTDARAEIAEALGRPVHLFLFVKVRSRWSDDPARYREIGLEFE